MLVAGDAPDRDRRAEESAVAGAEIGIAIADLRQNGGRHVQEPQQLVVPLIGGDVEELGAAGIGRVGGMDLAAGQPPEEKTVDRAEGELAGLCPRAGAFHMVEEPGDLGAGEIGVDDEAGLFGDERLEAVLGKLVADIGGAPVLPDDGVVDRLAGLAIPDHDGLALIGNADGGNVRC